MSIKGAKLRSITSTISWSATLGTPSGIVLWAGLVLSLICVHLQLDNFYIGLVNAIPNMVMPIQIISALIVMRFGKRRKIWFRGILLSRACIPLLGLIILYHSEANASWSIPLFIAVFLIFHSIAAVSVPLWFSWIGDLIPEHELPKFWGKRNTIAFIAGLVTSVLVGVVLDIDITQGSLLSGLIIASGILAFMEIYCYKNIRLLKKICG